MKACWRNGDTQALDPPQNKSAMNYSKWDNLEDSDDEEDTISKANKVNERAATALPRSSLPEVRRA